MRVYICTLHGTSIFHIQQFMQQGVNCLSMVSMKVQVEFNLLRAIFCASCQRKWFLAISMVKSVYLQSAFSLFAVTNLPQYAFGIIYRQSVSLQSGFGLCEVDIQKFIWMFSLIPPHASNGDPKPRRPELPPQKGRKTTESLSLNKRKGKKKELRGSERQRKWEIRGSIRVSLACPLDSRFVSRLLPFFFGRPWKSGNQAETRGRCRQLLLDASWRPSFCETETLGKHNISRRC